ncbi:flagellar type III secretion system protein FliR [Aliikangiella marina]|uniref:Flagellar biosynthetic protein FliR n=1 Tax=Aliikangiella marina TaxID=1712262 RepID=A0A545TDW5_9GAMM|nr:flagellar biosynthetic protein FliR [Aliikangiella marina]TQV75356.1 flagellar type III secretion system protein FliR [Aliikangiella marina]
MLINAETILTVMAAYILPFARLSGFLMTLAVVGSKNFPARFRMILALAMTALVAPVLPQTEPVQLFSLSGSILVIEQTLIGIVLGFVSRLLLETFVVGAQIIAMQSGLGFASLVDPSNGTSVPAMGQFFLMMTTLLFLAFDGHILMIRIIIESFYALPIGSNESIFPMFWQIVLWSKWIFATAILMALVCIASLLIVNIAFGVMTRAAPQINIFAVGFPLTMISGLILVWATLAYFLPYFEGQLSRAGSVMCSMIGVEC